MNPPLENRLPQIEAYSQTQQLAFLYIVSLACFFGLSYFYHVKTVYFVIMLAGLGIAGIYLFKDWFDQSPRLIINQQGVLDTRLKIGMIRWKDIKRVYGVSLNNIEHICFELYDEDKYLENRGSLTAGLNAGKKPVVAGITSINIVTSNLDVNTDDIFEAISKGCEIYSQPASSPRR